jgi:hypothetical protein
LRAPLPEAGGRTRRLLAFAAVLVARAASTLAREAALGALGIAVRAFFVLVAFDLVACGLPAFALLVLAFVATDREAFASELFPAGLTSVDLRTAVFFPGFRSATVFKEVAFVAVGLFAAAFRGAVFFAAAFLRAVVFVTDFFFFGFGAPAFSAAGLFAADFFAAGFFAAGFFAAGFLGPEVGDFDFLLVRGVPLALLFPGVVPAPRRLPVSLPAATAFLIIGSFPQDYQPISLFRFIW